MQMKKTCIIKKLDDVRKKNMKHALEMKKTCIKKTLHLMMQMKKTCIIKTFT